MNEIKKDHISFSEWGMFLDCQHRWFLDYYEERRAEVYSCYMVFGKAIHAALEWLKDPDRKEKKWVDIDIAYEMFEKEFRTKYNEAREFDKKKLSDLEIDDFVESGIQIIKNIETCAELREAHVLFVEYELGLKISREDNVDIKFKGFIDVVLRSRDKRGKDVIWIVDYKTCSWGWNAEKRRDDHLQAQLRLYKHFFAKQFNIDYKNIRTAFVLLKRTPRGKDTPIEWFPFSSGDKTVMRAVNKLNESITEMHTTTEFKKNKSACINDFGDTCPYFKTPLCSGD